MTRPLASYDVARRARALKDQGWCAFEEAFDRGESLRLTELLHDFVDGLDEDRLAGFGATIFALAAREPRVQPFYRELSVRPFLEQALGSELAFRRTGARISGHTSHARIVWHHHHGWGADGLAARTGFERLLFIAYLGGTERALGPLIVRPRAFSDPFEEAPADRFAPLPGEVQLEYPPGTVVVMDAPVLHSALRGTGAELRVIWGAHVQSSVLERAHPEDDPPLEKVRVGVRHRAFRWGLRNGKRWLAGANRSELPDTSAY